MKLEELVEDVNIKETRAILAKLAKEAGFLGIETDHDLRNGKQGNQTMISIEADLPERDRERGFTKRKEFQLLKRKVKEEFGENIELKAWTDLPSPHVVMFI